MARIGWLHRHATLAAIAGVVVSASPLPKLIGMQGLDDQAMTDYAYSISPALLQQRYSVEAEQIRPGLRRYNFFWDGFEANPPTAQAQPCPPGTTSVPINETDRIARGFNLFHCYDSGRLTQFDTYLAADAAIGAASAFIMYGSPSWARAAGCTGFPWGPGPNYKDGCLPWGFEGAWEDFVLVTAERWHGTWGSGEARLSGYVIWNEVQSQGWADPSPVLPSRYSGAPYTPAQMKVLAGELANLTARAGRAAARWMPEDYMLWLSTDHFATAPALHTGDVMHVGLWDYLTYFWPALDAAAAADATLPNATSLRWGIAVHPYDAGDPRGNLSSSGIYTFATLSEMVADVQCGWLTQYGGFLRPSAGPGRRRRCMRRSRAGRTIT